MKLARRVLPALLFAAWTAMTAVAAEVSYRIEVAGLACPFCAYGIEKKLNTLEGVERVETHIKEGAVIITMVEGATLDEAAARQAVEEAGFTLDGFERMSGSDKQ